MAAPFPEAGYEILVYATMGALAALLAAVSYYAWKLKQRLEDSQKEEKVPEVDKIGLSKKAEDVLKTVMDEAAMQSDLPGKLNVSKATVSQAVSELRKEGLIKRRKKANSYLIEPDMDAVKERTGTD